MTSQPPSSEELALRRPLFACLLIAIGYVLFQGRSPFVQIAGLVIGICGLLTLGQIAWANLAQWRELQKRVIAIAEQEAKQETRRERHARRREIERTERERTQQRKAREAKERKALQQAVKEEQQRIERDAKERDSAFNTEVDRLIALSTAERRREFHRLMQTQGYTVESEKPLSIGRLMTLKKDSETANAVLIESGRQRAESDLNAIAETVASSEPPVEWVVCFDGFAIETVLALKDRKLSFVDPIQLAIWSIQT